MEQVLGKWCNGINVGYLRELKLVPITDILQFNEPLVFSDTNIFEFDFNNLELVDNPNVFVIDFYKKECIFSEKSTTDAAGNLYELSIAWSWVSNQGELMDWIYRNQYRKWIAFFTDQNGRSYVGGSVELPMELSYSRSVDSRSAIRMGLFCKNWHPAWFVPHINLAKNKMIDLRRYAARDIVVYEGDTIYQILVFRDGDGVIENLTGNSFKMQVRRTDGTIVTSFTMTDGFSLQNSNTELVMQKSDLISAGDYVYDLQRTLPDGKIETQLKGAFIVEPQITT